MPLYSYTSEDGDTITIASKVNSRRPWTIRRNGKVYHRDIAADQASTPPSAAWPKLERNMQVNECQLAEVRASDERGEVPTEYVKDGYLYSPKMRSREHRRRYMWWHRAFDKQAGYGDAVPE